MELTLNSNIYDEWIAAKRDEENARRRRFEVEEQILNRHGFDPTDEGTKTEEVDGYKIKVTSRMTRKVDAEKAREIAIENGFDDQLSRLFRWKAEINTKVWKSTDAAITGPFVEAIETKPGKPGVSVELITDTDTTTKE